MYDGTREGDIVLETNINALPRLNFLKLQYIENS